MITILDVLSLPFVASHILDDLDRVYSISESLDSELEKECENGRLLKILFKLNSINERANLLRYNLLLSMIHPFI